MGLKMRLSQSFLSTSKSISGRISERVILLVFLGSRASSRACQLAGMWRATHIAVREEWRCLRMGVGVACSMLIVRPEGPGDLVPHLWRREVWNVSKGIGSEVMWERA